MHKIMFLQHAFPTMSFLSKRAFEGRMITGCRVDYRRSSFG